MKTIPETQYPFEAIISVEEAVSRLRSSEVVAIPTETVYGLGGKISCENAIHQIFSTKKRPFFDPLIVHVHSVDQASKLTTAWSPAAEALAKAFWPGPLTLVLPKKPFISDLITSGLPTVGLRLPRHPLARAIIEKLGEPLAAPSANLFGQTSPSKAVHVLAEFKGQVPVVDGGDCDVGIESTIVKVIEDHQQISLTILRAGQILPQQLVESLKSIEKEIKIYQPGRNIEAPGQVKHHYMPSIPLIYVDQKKWDAIGGAPEKLNKELGKTFEKIAQIQLHAAPEMAARQLYSLLRDRSMPPNEAILFIHEAHQQGDAWEPILDRLRRAATYHLLQD